MIRQRWGKDREPESCVGPLPSRFGASREGSKAVLPPMAIVWRCVLDVEAYAAAGRDVVVPRQDCPDCHSPMIFWSGYERRVRRSGQVWRIWVRRGKCKACGGRSHALLPAFGLIGRRHDVEVIGTAVVAVMAGVSIRSAAQAARVARSTVRSWCRRHRERARVALLVVVAMTTAWGMGGQSSLNTSEEVLALLVLAGVASADQGGLSFWPAVSLATGGAWLVPLPP